MEWKCHRKCNFRETAVEFYRTIDIQFSFRPTHPRYIINHMNPLKLSNAGSFGIPTVSYPEPAYVAEWKDECIWSESITQLVKQAKMLSVTPSLYKELSEKAIKKAESYHIDNIAKLYLKLGSL